MDLTKDKGYTQEIIAEGKRQNLLRNQLAYVLATALWETNFTMKPVIEAYWLTEAWRKRHLRYWPWYGRGFVQLTWENNYKKAAKKLDLPLLATKPELALDPVTATKIIITGMKEGWFTGKKLSDHITLQKSDFKNARRIINGIDKAGEIAALARQYDALLKASGYGEDE